VRDFSLLNYSDKPEYSKNQIESEFEKGKSRGPENSQIYFNEENNTVIGFHRLAINGLNEKSNQPLNIQSCTLICNGEIYNYKELYKELNLQGETDSDCEIIIHLYKKFGIEHALTLLDGVFAFILLDKSINQVFIGRDPLGIRPLYKLMPYHSYNIVGFASELKCLHFLYKEGVNNIVQFTPGTYSVYKLYQKLWFPTKIQNKKYIILSPAMNYLQNPLFDESPYTSEQNIYKNIRAMLYNAVYKRYINTERPIACLLSGGLDSSLIAGLVSLIHKNNSNPIPIETYSIGLKDSEDIKYARKVADFIQSNHTEIIISEDEMFDEIETVIKTIESYDVTSVRASIGNYLLGKYIAKNSEAKVIFNGDGSDELCGGYLYMNCCPSSIEFDEESRRLLKDIHMFDVLRSDKCISSHGLEPRTPFLDRTFVNYYLSIPVITRNHNINGTIEKYLLRTAFQNCGIIPEEILWRKKEAFSDGVSNQGRSLYQIIQEKIKEKNGDVGNLKELEKNYYKTIFEKHYKGLTTILPYYWMPKYINSDDPSARTLSIYKTEPAIQDS
jgi:asparagine synthase (glutamine-hydrolysing)